MRKEMSQATIDTMYTTNRRKVKELVEGEDILFFEDGKLMFGQFLRCNKCPNGMTVNAGVVCAETTTESALLKHHFVASKRLLRSDTAYSVDGDGIVRCPECQENSEVA